MILLQEDNPMLQRNLDQKRKERVLENVRLQQHVAVRKVEPIITIENFHDPVKERLLHRMEQTFSGF